MSGTGSIQSGREARAGLGFGLAAYLSWGLVPLYFKQVSSIAPIQVLAHRVIWSVVFLAALLSMQGRWRELVATVRSRRTLGALALTTILIASNWLVFIYAVSNNLVLEASLGYFINPLVNVMLGMVFLRERLRRWQLAGVALAVVGVGNLAVMAGQVPWISLALALSFGFYGLVRKTTRVGPLIGLAIETALLLPLGMSLIGFELAYAGEGYGASMWGWLAASGLVTAVPLLWFAKAAQRLRLSTLGFLQYIAPTMHFLIAVVVFREQFSWPQAMTFGFIWAALVIYSVDSFRAIRSQPSPCLAAEGRVLSDM